MATDFPRQLEYLGVPARLKRLSDALSQGIRDFYKAQAVDIEPSWHLVFLYLQDHESATMSELSEAFGMSLPAIFNLCGKMEKRGYVTCQPDPRDNRRKQIELTGKAKAELPRLAAIWNAGQVAIRTMLEKNPEFLNSLSQFENELRHEDFKSRSLAVLQGEPA